MSPQHLSVPAWASGKPRTLHLHSSTPGGEGEGSRKQTPTEDSNVGLDLLVASHFLLVPMHFLEYCPFVLRGVTVLFL